MSGEVQRLGGLGRGGGQSIQSRLCTDSSEPDEGLKLMNSEIMS